jgi:DNA-binding SARP family transcriptional activator
MLTGFAVSRDGAVLRESELGSRRARMLLRLLAAEHGHRVSLDRIIDVLWGANPPRRAADNVAVLVSRLRRLLGSAVIAGGRDGYQLASEPLVDLDTTRAERLVVESQHRLAAHEAGLAGAAAAAALELLGAGLPLANEDPAWLAPLQTRLGTLLTQARHVAAEAALGTGDLDVGRRAAEAALTTDAFDEVAARQLMRIHVARGEPAKALLVYDELRGALSDALGVEPAAETRDAHLAVLREHPVAAPLDRVTEPASAGPSGAVGLVGREPEVAALTDAWSRAVSGVPALVLVAGEAGIGKTRLVSELAKLAETTGGAVFSARC